MIYDKLCLKVEILVIHLYFSKLNVHEYSTIEKDRKLLRLNDINVVQLAAVLKQ